MGINGRQFKLFLAIVFINSFIDLGQKITLLNVINTAYSGTTQVVWSAVLGALIILPSVLLITPSGFLADRFSKTRVTQWVVASTIPLSALALAGYGFGIFSISLFLMFLFSVQAVFYTPVRNAHIKELVGLDNIAKANAWVQAVIVFSILFSSVFYSGIFQLSVDKSVPTTAALLPQLTVIGIILTALSILQTVLSLGLMSGNPGRAEPFDWGRYVRLGYLKETMEKLWSNEIIWLSSVGLGIFFGVNQVLLSIFAAHVQAVTGVTNALLIQSLPACAGVGIILGALYSGRVSKHYIETGVLPVGTIGATLCLAAIPALDTLWSLGLAIFLFGFFCGIYIVPLTALIQYYAGDQDIGKISAADSFVQNTIMTAFLLVAIGLSTFHVPIPVIVWMLFAVGILGTLYVLIREPQFFVRFLLRFFASIRYRLNVEGMENIPESGPALLLGNHTSFLDWALLQIASPRPIRFVMARDIYQHWAIKWFLDIVNVIPISNTGSKDSIRAIESALKQGDLVALFPEGHLSRTGQLSKFHKGYELACKSTDAKIVPFYLKGLWGSSYSYATRRFKENLKHLGPRRLYVRFGRQMPSSSTGAQVKQRVLELSIRAWESYAGSLGTIGAEWLKVAKRAPGRLAVADSSGIELTHRELYVATRPLSRVLMGESSPNVGVILPAGAGGLIANLAVFLAGK
ncbi:MFS transporter, partial [bacterium]|nr:MFS transporter [bacterium]